MKNLIYLLLIIIFISSCSTYNQNSSEYKKTIHLIDPKILKKNTMILLYSNNDYELQIPLTSLVNHIIIKKDSELIELFKYAESLINENSENNLFPNEKFDLDYWGENFWVSYRTLFESAMYIVYDKKNDEYIREVTVESNAWIGGPLAAFISYKVFINDKIFWQHNISA